MARASLPGPRPVLRNPEQDAMVRLLTRYGPALPAAELFARVERTVPAPYSDYSALAVEALRLERRGLVVHRLENHWRLVIELTERGQRLVKLRHLDQQIQPRLLGASMLIPVLATACSWSKPTGPTAPPLPVRVERPVARLEPFYQGPDRPVEFLWCAPPFCPTPTPKQPAQGSGQLPPLALESAPVMAQASAAVVVIPTPAPVPSDAAMPGPPTALPADLSERIARSVSSQGSVTAPPGAGNIAAPPKIGTTPPSPILPAASKSRTTLPPAPPEAIEPPAAPRPVALQTPAAAPHAARRELHTAFFDFASADLRGAELAFAKRVALAARNGARVTIVGMTDRSGDSKKNERLAQRRADAMLLVLAQAGLDPDKVTVQIDTSGSRTVPPQTTARAIRSDGDATFRRVDVLITYGPEAPERLDRSASTTLFGVPSPYEIVSMRALAAPLLPRVTAPASATP